MQGLFLWISKIIILTYPIKPVKLGRWLGMAVNIYSGGPTRLRTYYKSALRALGTSLAFFIFFWSGQVVRSLVILYNRDTWPQIHWETDQFYIK